MASLIETNHNTDGRELGDILVNSEIQVFLDGDGNLSHISFKTSTGIILKLKSTELLSIKMAFDNARNLHAAELT